MSFVGSSNYAAEHSWESILESPEYFLHSINPRENTLEFVRTSRELISGTSFLDGRNDLSLNAQPVSLSMSDALQWSNHIRPGSEPNRFIFHMSFCGSTLVSRALDLAGKAICYKEPQVLLQLAELKAANTSLYRDKEQWKALTTFVLNQFKQPWRAGESVILKPSNWLNSMLPQLLEDGGSSKAVYLGLTPMAFLIAVFRGGGERIQFSYSVLRHLLHSFPEYQRVVAEVEGSEGDSIEQFARLVLILHAVQLKAFQRATIQGGVQESPFFDYQSLLANPLQNLTGIAAELDLDFTQDELQESISNNFSNHSKVNNRSYDATQASDVDQQVLNTYRGQFLSALEWASEALKPASFH